MSTSGGFGMIPVTFGRLSLTFRVRPPSSSRLRNVWILEDVTSLGLFIVGIFPDLAKADQHRLVIGERYIDVSAMRERRRGVKIHGCRNEAGGGGGSGHLQRYTFKLVEILMPWDSRLSYCFCAAEAQSGSKTEPWTKRIKLYLGRKTGDERLCDRFAVEMFEMGKLLNGVSRFKSRQRFTRPCPHRLWAFLIRRAETMTKSELANSIQKKGRKERFHALKRSSLAVGRS